MPSTPGPPVGSTRLATTRRSSSACCKVMSGGVSVNDGLFHVAQHDLPFGGVGNSAWATTTAMKVLSLSQDAPGVLPGPVQAP